MTAYDGSSVVRAVIRKPYKTNPSAASVLPGDLFCMATNQAGRQAKTRLGTNTAKGVLGIHGSGNFRWLGPHVGTDGHATPSTSISENKPFLFAQSCGAADCPLSGKKLLLKSRKNFADAPFL
jgi:hypothetical protein